MNPLTRSCLAACCLLTLILLPHSVAQDSENATVPSGLEFSKWSGSVNVPDPVAISFDNQGRAYVTQTTRRKAQDLDIREFRNWIPNDVSFQSVEDKRKFYHEQLAPGRSEPPYGDIEDLNGDGAVDYHDLTVLSEKIHLLTDTDADGTADSMQLFAEGFQTEVTGIAAGVLWYDGDVYTTIAPDVWRLRDKDGDDIADEREAIATGFGLHIAYGGHDMHGLTIGPDGRIYWSIGDKGISVTSKEGHKFHYPNQGGVLRCNPDGSDFEVFAHGLRNVQELAFDEFGNLFGVDNDSDQPDEKERFVYIVEGMDAGWRCNYQYRGSGYNPWADERLWVPYFEGQPGHILPPISNYENGPAGFTYNPGTALSPAYQNYFFLTGAPAGQQYAFQVRSKGASFEMINEHMIGNGIPLVGINFGPDGALYGVDWGGGYPLNQTGAVWKIDDPKHANDPARAEVKRLLAKGFNGIELEALVGHLTHADQRIRLAAQFELVHREATNALAEVTTSKQPLLARIHAIWGLGQRARQGDEAAIKPLAACLKDDSPEIVVQAVKTCGDLASFDGRLLLPLFNHPEPRVQFHAALAAAKHPTPEAYDAAFAIADEMYDVDLYMRHAFIRVFATCATTEQLADLYDYDYELVQQCAVIALRQRRDPAVAEFLNDLHDHVAADAARAIHDDYSIPEALPALAVALEDFPFYSESYVRRAINANLRLGRPEDASRVVAYAADDERPMELRLDALDALATWLEPPALDRVDGRYRTYQPRFVESLAAAIAPHLPTLVKDSASKIQTRAMALATKYRIELDGNTLFALVADSKAAAELRAEALKSLVAIESPSTSQALEVALSTKVPSLRTTARTLLANLDKAAALASIQQAIADSRDQAERQEAVLLLADLATAAADRVLIAELRRFAVGQTPVGSSLELLEAAELRANDNEVITDWLSTFKATRESDAENPLTQFDECRVGGSAESGKEIFTTHLTAACVRCHRVGRTGSTVGPDLEGIATKRDANYLLRSIIAPSADIDEKYRTQVVFLESGRIVQGLLRERTEKETILFDSQGKEVRITNAEIEEIQEQKVSIMPEMSKVLTRREIRDLVAYLSTLQQPKRSGTKN